MTTLLTSGQILQTQLSGQTCQIIKILGSGGQGEVYSAEWAGKIYAVKWYYSHTATEDQRAILEKLIKDKDYSSPNESFLWPLDIVYSSVSKEFGYIMGLRSQRFKSLLDLMTNRIDPTSRALVTAGLNLADSFFKLHMKGLCYRDINFGNAFFDPNTGEILICDNDNVGKNRSTVNGVLGTPDFIAPELVRQEAMPSKETDLFSLATLLFYMFHISHPLVGKKILNIRIWDMPARNKLFGTEPVFIFDPIDKSNEAVDKSIDKIGEAGHNALMYWKIYPQILRDTFIKAFTDGIRNPENGRVLEGEWRRVLSQLRDSIYHCQCSKDGTENFYDQAYIKSSGGKNASCWSCKKEVVLPFRIQIGKSLIMLTKQGEIYPHHLDSSKDFNFNNPAGKIIQHPTDPNIWGLKNLTTEKWVATMANGSLKDVEPEKSVPLGKNVKINFGNVIGEICY